MTLFLIYRNKKNKKTNHDMVYVMGNVSKTEGIGRLTRIRRLDRAFASTLGCLSNPRSKHPGLDR